MKKIIFLLACTATIAYGSEEEARTVQRSPEYEHIKLQIQYEELAKKSERRHVKIQQWKNQSYWNYGLAVSVGSLIRGSRIIAFIGASVCSINLWNPDFFSDKYKEFRRDEDVTIIKKGATELTRMCVKYLAEKARGVIAQSEAMHASNPEKANRNNHDTQK